MQRKRPRETRGLFPLHVSELSEAVGDTERDAPVELRLTAKAGDQKFWSDAYGESRVDVVVRGNASGSCEDRGYRIYADELWRYVIGVRVKYACGCTCVYVSADGEFLLRVDAVCRAALIDILSDSGVEDSELVWKRVRCTVIAVKICGQAETLIKVSCPGHIPTDLIDVTKIRTRPKAEIAAAERYFELVAVSVLDSGLGAPLAIGLAALRCVGLRIG